MLRSTFFKKNSQDKTKNNEFNNKIKTDNNNIEKGKETESMVKKQGR